MLDLILNGPTINGIKKDEVRAMLRETYTALKQYEKIGPMASPFINDPTAIVARAFSELYPGVEYVAQYVHDLRDETNGTAYGLTIFPDGGDSNDSGWYAPAAPAASSGGTSIGSVVVLIIGIFLVWMVLDALRYSRYRRRYIVGAPVNVVRPVYYPIFWG